jgi:sugar diacid utilization regulator
MPHSHGDTMQEPLTLRSLLEEPLLRNAVAVVSDDSDLDRHVAWCLPWAVAVRGTEALDGVLVHADQGLPEDDPKYLRRTITSLQRRGASAVAANTAEEFDLVVRDACKNAHLPLLGLPPETSYLALSRLIAEKNLANAAHVLQYGVTVHHALGEVLYRGAGLAAMARQIARLSSCPVVVLDTHLEVLVTDLKALDPAVASEQLLRELRDLIGTGVFATNGPHGKASTATLTLDSGELTIVTAPIVLGGTTYGWIVLVERDHPPGRHDLAQHLVIAAEAATITGSEMLRLRSVEAAEERARGDFVHALLHGRFSSAHEVVARASHHGFDVEAPYGVVVVQGAFDTSTPSGLERQGSLVRSVRRMQPAPGLQALATAVGDLLVVVPQLSLNGAARDPRTELDTLAAFAGDVDNEVRKRVGDVTGTTYGRPGVGAAGVANSYREARVALGVAHRLGMDRPCGYPELRVYAALSELTESRQALSFAKEVLEPLRSRDESGDSLEKVVLAYIEAGGNLNAAARSLHLHRNTMFYKLERVSRLLRVDLRDPDAMFTIWLAHRIDLLATVESDVAAEIGPLADASTDPASSYAGDGPANVPTMPSRAAPTHAPNSSP